jgi:AsmA-like C-terminal region
VRRKSRRTESRPDRRRRFRWVLGAAATLAAIACGVVIVVAIRSPFTQQRVAQGLESTAHSKVTIGKFRMVYFPHVGCVAENVTFAGTASRGGSTTLGTIQKMAIEARYADLIARPGYIARIVLDGLHVTVPAPGTGGGTPSTQPSTVRVGEIVADGTVLEVTRADDKPPLRFEIRSLTVRAYGPNSAWSYRVNMQNAEPPGNIISDGQFGPLNLQDLGSIPFSGSYKFQNANLGVFRGIAGTLSSAGEFAGRLGEIGIRGTIDIPDFQAAKSGRPVHLTSLFHAKVNGTNGDVSLTQVETSFLQTSVASSGSVAGKPGQKGKTTSLDVQVDKGRLQDLLQLFVTTKHPPMNGAMSFKAHIAVPAQGRPFLTELTLVGDFGIGEGTFTKPSMQTRVDTLSQSARGEKKDQNKAKPNADAEDPENVVLNLRGHVEVRDGVAKFTTLSFNVPGASAHMDGSYNLLNQQIDFHGMLKTDAQLSQETSGIKSALLKPLDPLFKRKKAGAAVPVKMTGTYQDPHFGFDAVGEIKPK